VIRAHREGHAASLFANWRYIGDREPNPDFILNREPWKHAKILLADRNFGCGSSRERAPKALREFGFRALVAPSFGGIFFNNCWRNGMVPVELELPDAPYIAVKFYTRPTWPHTEQLQTWTQDTVTKLATKANLVLLDAGLHTDDHGEMNLPTTHQIVSLKGKLTPQNNLAIQSAVLAKARAFVGTDPPAELAAAMKRAWTAFATTGDPGWPAYTTGRRAVARFGSGADPGREVIDDPRGDLRELWDGIR